MVWNTAQSAEYEANRRFEKPVEERCTRECPRRPPKPANKGLFDDGDTLLLFALIIILAREKSDQSLIFALLIALMM